MNSFRNCSSDYRIIDLEESRYQALLLTGSHRVFLVDTGTAERLQRGPDYLNAAEATEWRLLNDSGLLQNNNGLAIAAAGVTDGSQLAVNVNLTAGCNLGCVYCFAAGGDYGRLHGNMNAQAADDIISLVRSAGLWPSRPIRFEFFGGEPLLNVHRIEQIVSSAISLAQSEGIRPIFRISTNLSVLPPQAVSMLTENRFIVSVSIDGGRKTQDRNRPGKDGSGTYDTIIKNCSLLRAVSEDVVLVARMTVTDNEEDLGTNIRSLHSLNLFDWFQILPVTGPNTDDDAIYAQFAKFFSGHQYLNLFSENNRFKGILECERLVQMILEGMAAPSFCSGGRTYFTVSPDRSIMPCHRLVGETDYKIGELTSGITGDLDPWQTVSDRLPNCSSCAIRYLCAGGCKQENLTKSGNLIKPTYKTCAQQDLLVDAATRFLVVGEGSYRDRSRSFLDDLFVSCGRPVLRNKRSILPSDLKALIYFRPVTS